MGKYEKDTIPICVDCDKHEEQLKVCEKCHVNYCVHFASTTDLRFCANCMGDFTLKETIMEKQVIHEKPDGTISFSRKYMARHIQLLGTDWLFAAKLIEDMPDDEIEASVEYHRANVSLLLQERESRKTERMHKLSQVKIVPVKRESAFDKEQREKKEAAKKGKKGKKAAQVSAASVVQNAIDTLRKAGVSDDQIAAIMAGVKK